jgi:WD40 repeat protein
MAKIHRVFEIDFGAGCIANMRWSPDGSLLAVPTESGATIIFEKEKRRVIRKIGPHDGWVTAVAWDRRAECILTGSVDRSVGLWRVETGERAPFNVDGHRTPVHSIEWTDEEAYAITCSADRLRVLDGACLLAGWKREDEDRVNEPVSFTAASCSRQSTFLLAIAADHGKLLRLVSFLSGNILSSVQLTSAVRCVAWSPAGDLLAAGDDAGVSLRQCTQEGFDGAPRRLSLNGSNVRALAFSPSGECLAVADDVGIDIWNLRDNRSAASFQNPVQSPDGELLYGLAFHPFEPLIAATDSSGRNMCLLDVSEALQ